MAAKLKTNLQNAFCDADDNGTTTGEKQSFRRPCRISVGGHRQSVTLSPSVRKRSFVNKRSSVSGRPPLALTTKAIEQQLSNVGRNHFLKSFGKDTLFGYEGVESLVLPGKSEEISEKQRQNLMEFILKKSSGSQNQITTEKHETSKRIKRPVTVGTFRKAINSEWIYEDILEIRGRDYSSYGGDICFDLKEKIRSQSARRRIRRIMLGDKEKAQKENEIEETTKQNYKAVRKTFKETCLPLLEIKENTGTFDLFLEKKKWLAERRRRKGLSAIRKFRWAARLVVNMCKVFRAVMANAVDRTPETAAQRSWNALQHSSEAEEILFNMSIFQKGKSQYAYVPDWAKSILSKPPMDRTERDLSQLHAILQGLHSYDKFTYRIQLAMCRAMTYQKVENGRVILRKGHEGMAFYFIFSGSVFVNVEEMLKKSGDVVWHTSVILSRGDSFGELALLRKIKRTASVVVREDIELLVVDKDVFAVTCPKIYDKELRDKIKFCKSLDIFQEWTDDMIRNICFEAQIQEWKSNKIIVKDSSKETEWIYICMQGKCSVIKALDLKIPPGTVGPRKVTFEESYFAVFGNGHRSQNSFSDVWKKDLQKGIITQAFNFMNKEKKVDESYEPENEPSDKSDTEDEVGKLSAQDESSKEKIIEVMALSCSNMLHTKGDSQYCEVDDEKAKENAEPIEPDDLKYTNKDVDQSQLVLEKKIKSDSFTLLDLMRLKNSSGTLNKDVVYLTIASMQPGDIFDLSEILMPTGRKLMLVSKGAVILKIKRADYIRYSNKPTLKQARDIALNSDYPSDEVLYRSYNNRCAWENYKREQVSSTMKEVQDVCVRHNEAFKLKANVVRQPIKNVKGILRKETVERKRLEKLDKYLSFVYGPNKGVVTNDEMEASPFVSQDSADFV